MASARKVTCALYLYSVYNVVLCENQADLIKNITLSLTFHFSINCLIIFRGFNESPKQFETFKALSSDLRSPVGVYTFQERQSGKGCTLPLNIIIGEDLKGEFAGFTNRASMAGEIWLIFLNTSALDFVKGSRPSFDSEVVVAEMLSPQEILFKEIYAVDEGFPLRIVNYGKWTSKYGLDLVKLSLYDRRRNLEGKVFRVGSNENWPVSSFRTGVWDGFMPTLWKEIEDLINCTTVPIRSVDGSTGLDFNDGTWNGLVGMLLNDTIDVVAAELTVTERRMGVLKYAYPAIVSRNQIFFKALGYKLEWKAIFKPLALSTWLALCGWTVLGSLCISLLYYWYNKNGIQGCEEIHFTKTESFFFILQSLCQQGYPIVPKSLSCRIIFVTAYALSTIMIPSYSASLISSLTYQTPVKPFDSLEEMVSQGKYKLLVKRNSAAFTHFSKATSPLYDEIYRKYIDEKYRHVPVDNTLGVLDNIVCKEKNYALYGIDLIITLKMEHKSPRCSILKLSQPLTPVSISLAFKKDSPFSGIVNFNLLKLQSIGSTNRMKTGFRPMHIGGSNKMVFRQVEMDEAFQMFVVLLLGLIISVIILAMEFAICKINSISTENQMDKKLNKKCSSDVLYMN